MDERGSALSHWNGPTGAGGKAWRILPSPPLAYTRRMRGMPYLWARLLYHRGIRSPEEAEAFLQPAAAVRGDPFLLPGMGSAVRRLQRALASGETIAIFGDFDADGVTATALLTDALRSLGAHVRPYIPHRAREGHGLNPQAVAGLAEGGATLLVTVDCGVSSSDEVAQAKALGLDTIITDHHTPPPTVPQAEAVVDPRLSGSRYPFPHLAGVGLAWKLAQALYRHLGRAEADESALVELVAIGTVADVAPLIGENRYLVARGLEELNRTRRPGLQELLSSAGLGPGALDTESIAYAIAPRLNAAGRVDHAMAALDLLLSPTSGQAAPLAEELERLNGQRQRLTSEVSEQVWEEARQSAAGGEPLILVAKEGLPVGIIGLAAGKLSEELYRPAVVVSRGEEVSRGSARSIPEFNMVAALTQCSDLFVRFGGHSQAAGFDIATERLPHLSQRLVALAQEQLAGIRLQPQIKVDAVIPLSVLRGTTAGFLRSLAPFGAGNLAPVFLSRAVEVVDVRLVGAQEEHLMLKLQDDVADSEGSPTENRSPMRRTRCIWNAVAFGQGRGWEPGTKHVDLVYTVGADSWHGADALRLRVLDFRRSGPLRQALRVKHRSDTPTSRGDTSESPHSGQDRP